MPSVTATIYLTLQGRRQQVEAPLGTQSTAFSIGEDLQGRLFVFQGEPQTPQWAETLRESGLVADGNFPAIESKSAGAVLTVGYHGADASLSASFGSRTFVICFGTGWQRLHEYLLEPTFGRTVALNVLDANQLLELKTEQVFALRHMSTDRAPVLSQKSAFNLDSDRDLLDAVEGKVGMRPIANVAGAPLEALLPPNAKIRGSQGLRLTFDPTLLRPILTACLNEFHSTAYRQAWPEVDFLRQVMDQAEAVALDGQLDAMLRAQTWSSSLQVAAHGKKSLQGAVPHSFVLGRMPARRGPNGIPSVLFISEQTWRGYLQTQAPPATPTLVAARETKVHCLDESSDEMFETTIFNCLSAETQNTNGQYFLSEGKWYRAEPHFLNSVRIETNQFLAPNQQMLPHWNQGDTERLYNTNAAAQNGWIMLDARNILYGGGQSKFEVCDFLDPATRTLYFVKRADTSAPLSHLCEQVRRTVELLFGADPGFRDALATYGQQHQLQIPNELTGGNRPSPPQWSLALVTLCRNRTNPLDRLPLFARCSLRRVAKQMSQLGHPVQLYFR